MRLIKLSLPAAIAALLPFAAPAGADTPAPRTATLGRMPAPGLDAAGETAFKAAFLTDDKQRRNRGGWRSRGNSNSSSNSSSNSASNSSSNASR